MAGAVFCLTPLTALQCIKDISYGNIEFLELVFILSEFNYNGNYFPSIGLGMFLHHWYQAKKNSYRGYSASVSSTVILNYAAPTHGGECWRENLQQNKHHDKRYETCSKYIACLP
jgi:hypothetical protein